MPICISIKYVSQKKSRSTVSLPPLRILHLCFFKRVQFHPKSLPQAQAKPPSPTTPEHHEEKGKTDSFCSFSLVPGLVMDSLIQFFVRDFPTNPPFISPSISGLAEPLEGAVGVRRL